MLFNSLRTQNAKLYLKNGPVGCLAVEAIETIRSEIIRLKIEFEQVQYAQAEHSEFLKKFYYPKNFPNYKGHALQEKSFQHFFCFQQFLKNENKGNFVDIACWDSPLHEIISASHNTLVFRQDMQFKTDLSKNIIGGSATHLPFANESIDFMSLTCSLEHFENYSDILFFQEAARVLAPNGRIICIPLYMNDFPCTHTDPEIFQSESINFDGGTDIYSFENWKNRHGRFYSPQTLLERIIEPQLGFLKFKVIELIDAPNDISTKWILSAQKLETN